MRLALKGLKISSFKAYRALTFSSLERPSKAYQTQARQRVSCSIDIKGMLPSRKIETGNRAAGRYVLIYILSLVVQRFYVEPDNTPSSALPEPVVTSVTLVIKTTST